MKTIESCEMSSPSPPTLEDPDVIKLSQNGDEEVIKAKNGLKNDDPDEIGDSEKINGDTDLNLKKNILNVESNGTKDEFDEKSEQILHDDVNNSASPTENSGITDSSSDKEEDKSSPDQSIDKNNIEKQKDAQEQGEIPEAMEVDPIPAGDSKCEEQEKKEIPPENSITKEQETKLPEKDKDFEIPADLLERRRLEQAKKESDVKKPEAILELVAADDTDSETEDSDNKNSISKSNSDAPNEQDDSKKDDPKDDTDYNEALENLTKIQAESKKINDDELLSVKVASGNILINI